MSGLTDPAILGAPERDEGGRSLWADARRRFVRNRAAMAGLVVLLLIALFAFGGGLLARHDPATVNFTLIGVNAYKGVPSLETGYYFGTDAEGRDLYARTVQGTRLSLLIGLVGSLVAVVVGTLYGAVSGYLGGRADGAMMRLVDILLSIPFMFVLILLLVMFGRSLLVMFVGIGLTSWLSMARIARGQTLSIKGKEFVEAAVATGVRPSRIVLRHVVPNLAGVVVVYATLLVPEMILYESFISWLGLGVQEPNTSLGALISAGSKQILGQYTEPWQLWFPLGIFVAMLFSLYFVGDGLRDALDPKDR